MFFINYRKTDKQENSFGVHIVSVFWIVSIFDLSTNKSCWTQTKLGYFFFELSNFCQFFALTHRQNNLRLKNIPCCAKEFNARHN